jgi:hypothetical protein
VTHLTFRIERQPWQRPGFTTLLDTAISGEAGIAQL